MEKITLGIDELSRFYSIQWIRAQKMRIPFLINPGEWEERMQFFEGKCAYCQERPAKTVEHFIPVTLGGGTTRDNIVPACDDCNNAKGGMHPSVVQTIPREDIDRVAKYLQQFRNDSGGGEFSVYPQIGLLKLLNRFYSTTKKIQDKSLALRITQLFQQILALATAIKEYELTEGLPLPQEIIDNFRGSNLWVDEETTIQLVTAYLIAANYIEGIWVPIDSVTGYIQRMEPSAPYKGGSNFVRRLFDKLPEFFETKSEDSKIWIRSNPSLFPFFVPYTPEIVSRTFEVPLERSLIKAFQAAAKGNEWTLLSMVGKMFKIVEPNKTIKDFGFGSFNEAIRAFPLSFEVIRQENGHFKVRCLKNNQEDPSINLPSLTNLSKPPIILQFLSEFEREDSPLKREFLHIVHMAGLTEKWVYLSEFAKILKSHNPEFSIKKYGYPTFLSAIRAFPHYFDIALLHTGQYILRYHDPNVFSEPLPRRKLAPPNLTSIKAKRSFIGGFKHALHEITYWSDKCSIPTEQTIELLNDFFKTQLEPWSRDLNADNSPSRKMTEFLIEKGFVLKNVEDKENELPNIEEFTNEEESTSIIIEAEENTFTTPKNQD